MKKKCTICGYIPTIMNTIINSIRMCSHCAGLYIINLEKYYPKEYEEILTVTRKKIRRIVKR